MFWGQTTRADRAGLDDLDRVPLEPRRDALGELRRRALDEYPDAGQAVALSDPGADDATNGHEPLRVIADDGLDRPRRHLPGAPARLRAHEVRLQHGDCTTEIFQ